MIVSETHSVSRTRARNRRVSQQRNRVVIRAVNDGGGAAEDGNKALVSNKYRHRSRADTQIKRRRREAWDSRSGLNERRRGEEDTCMCILLESVHPTTAKQCGHRSTATTTRRR